MLYLSTFLPISIPRFMRKFTAGITIVAALLTHVPVRAQSFADVNVTPYSDAYAYLSQRRFVEQGRPNDPLNRAEALKLIVVSQEQHRTRADWFKTHMPPISLFQDVNQSVWYAPYVETGFERRLITGYPDGTFRGGNLLRTEEAVAMLMRAYGETGGSSGFEQSPFIQNRPGEWFTPHINSAIRRNIVMQTRNQMILGTPISRGQFFDMVYRMHTIREQNVASFTGREPLQTASVPRDPIVRRPVNNGGQINAPQPIQAQRPPAATTASSHPHASSLPFSVSIPAAGIKDLPIIHPTDPFSSEGVLAPLQHGVGHLFSYPGGGGKIMVYGHSSGYPWDVSQYTKIFREINKLNPGDRIYVTYNSTLYVYEVTFEEAIPAADTSRFNDNGQGEELILYTCWPPDSIAQRYLVHALPVETVALR